MKLNQCFSDNYSRRSTIFGVNFQNQGGKCLDGSVFFDFVDRYVVKHLRKPDILLPAGLLDDGMHQALQTQFQQYLYLQGKEHHKRAANMHADQALPNSWSSEFLTKKADVPTPQNEPFVADRNAALTQKSRKSEIGVEAASGSNRLSTSLELVNFYFSKHKMVIAKDLLKKENEAMFKLFYHTRWFHVAPPCTAPVQLSNLYKKFQINQLFVEDQATALFIHVLTGLGRMFSEHCEVVTQIITEKKSIETMNNEKISREKYHAILSIYTHFWRQYATAVVKIDQNFSQMNDNVNQIYSQVERDNDIDEDPQLFSILRWAMIIWHKKVFKKCFKSFEKALKLQVQNYFKIVDKQMEQRAIGGQANENDPSEDKYQIEKNESEALIIKARDCLIDLSLNYSTVNFLEHSSFVDLTGDQYDDIEEFSPRAQKSLQIDWQATANLIETNDPNMKKKLQNEAYQQRMLNQPSIVFKKIILQESVAYLENHILQRQRIMEDYEFWIQSMDKSLFFEQSLGLKKQMMSEICAVVFQPIKNNINNTHAKYLRKLQAKGGNIKDVEKQENKDKEPIFRGYLGKYMNDKGIIRYVQKHIFKNGIISPEEINLFNTLSMEYKILKNQVRQKDGLIMKTKKVNIEFSRDFLNLCIEPCDYGTIETDAKQNVQCRNRITIFTQKVIKKNSQGGASNVYGGQEPLLPIAQNGYSTQRFTLVPYDNYRNSLIQVARDSIVNMSEETRRKSSLYENFDDISSGKDHPQLKDLSIDKSKMLDFFGFSHQRQQQPPLSTNLNTNQTTSSPLRSTMAHPAFYSSRIPQQDNSAQNADAHPLNRLFSKNDKQQTSVRPQTETDLFKGGFTELFSDEKAEAMKKRPIDIVAHDTGLSSTIDDFNRQASDSFGERRKVVGGKGSSVEEQSTRSQLDSQTGDLERKITQKAMGVITTTATTLSTSDMHDAHEDVQKQNQKDATKQQNDFDKKD